jgi:hypothetical protein
MAEPETERKGEALPVWEAAADEAIALHDGDARAAIVALLHQNEALEHELAVTKDAVSLGYARGFLHRDGRDVQTKG